MTPSEDQIAERLPIWAALSEFFLDTELSATDYERISECLALSHYSETELEKILIHEVAPVCGVNLLSVAGEWAGFDRDWLKKNISPRYGSRPSINLNFLRQWAFKNHWREVHTRVLTLRSVAER